MQQMEDEMRTKEKYYFINLNLNFKVPFKTCWSSKIKRRSPSKIESSWN